MLDAPLTHVGKLPPKEAVYLLAAIVDSSEDAIISKDLNSTITSWNKSAQRVFGYKAEEVIGKPITILIPDDRKQEEPEILAKIKRGERVDHFETIRRRKDGTLLNISLTISPIKDARGRIIGASKIARDITYQKRAEYALKESEARFRQLADSMPQIVWTANPDGYIDYYNERWYEFTGFDRNEFGDPSWEPILHPDDLELCSEGWYEAVKTGQPYTLEYRFWDKRHNSWRWFLGRAAPARDEEGRIIKWFGTSTDIHDQKKAQEELRHLNADLEQFAYSASHDLQEPLRAIKIYSEILSEDYSQVITGEGLDFLNYLRSAASRMEMLVHDLLAYTRVSKSGQISEEVSANNILDGCLDDLRSAIMESGAVITAEPLPVVQVNRAHLKQLFQNLIGNAIKYRSPEKIPVIHISASQGKGLWVFRVRDNGIGIKPEYKEKIFGLFTRLHTNDKYSGTGIGLAICKRIVERYHGQIWVESEPEKGSTFCFTLPVSHR